MGPWVMAAAVVLSMAAAAAAADGGGYLFVTFRGEQTAQSEQIYLATSPDGRAWTALNGGQPTLLSTVGERGVRDPFLLRTHDGKGFVLIATDLSIHHDGDWRRAVRAGSRAIVIWQSADLVHWTGPRRVVVAADDAGCTWAPQAVYDEQAGDYLVFWASTSRGDDFAKQRIWACHTADFVTFGRPAVWIEHDRSVIDTDLVRDGGRYYRFSKDEQDKAITMEAADRLAGPWRAVPGFTLGTLRGYEGPACFALAPAAGRPTWCLLLDHYSKGDGYKPFVCRDLAGGRFEPAGDFTFPFRFRHGSVTPITAAEMTAVRQAYGPPGGRK